MNILRRRLDHVGKRGYGLPAATATVAAQATFQYDIEFPVVPDDRVALSPRNAGRGAARGDMSNRGAKAGEDGEVPDTPD
jgi:hypothetical protein